jgi:hypothetical protein
MVISIGDPSCAVLSNCIKKNKEQKVAARKMPAM